ncbi:MAG: O-antigen ligase family protein [Bacteroidota bacterium]|nr:O-antigen ligase family protein [Bacteroidota bacterium]
MNENKTVRIIDKLIPFFFVTFLLSFSNSIFINQVGYYGCLLLILGRYYLTKENPFIKTGLEFALAWFLAADFISFLFTTNHPQGFQFFLRRALLVPIIYTTIAACKDYKRTLLYFKIYIAGAIGTMLIYLYVSYKYLINNLYTLLGTGPSMLQFSITASEVMSFAVIILFAFLVNEKTSRKVKILTLILFAVSALSLFATYKRTGWLGAGISLLLILTLTKKWKTIIVCLALFAIVLVKEKNISEVKIFNMSKDSLSLQLSVKTPGRANDFLEAGNTIFISDNENGLTVLEKDKAIKKMDFPSPIISIAKVNDSLLLAGLLDTRFLLLKNVNGKYEQQKEYLSPGFTTNYQFLNNNIYIADADSGLTVFSQNGGMIYHNSRVVADNIAVDSQYTIMYSQPNKFVLYKNENLLPKEELVNSKNGCIAAYLDKGKIITADDKGLNLFVIVNNQIRQIDSYKLENLYKLKYYDSSYYALTLQGKLVKLNITANKLSIANTYELKSVPTFFYVSQNKLFTSYIKRSRILSVIDPYQPANYNRFAFWRAGIKIFKDHPVFGVGDIDFNSIYKQYKRTYDKEIQGHLHNNFIHILAALGLFGFLAFVYLIFRIFKVNISLYRKVKDIPIASSYALGAIGCITFIVVSGLTELNFFDHEVATLLWFSIGLNIAFLRNAQLKNN